MNVVVKVRPHETFELVAEAGVADRAPGRRVVRRDVEDGGDLRLRWKVAALTESAPETWAGVSVASDHLPSVGIGGVVAERAGSDEAGVVRVAVAAHQIWSPDGRRLRVGELAVGGPVPVGQGHAWNLCLPVELEPP